MEGHLLSGRPAGQRNAQVLRPAVSIGRDQQYVLPNAEGVGFGKLGARGSRSFQVRAQSLATNHTHAAAQGRGWLIVVPARSFGRAEGTAWTVIVSVSAFHEERSRAASRISRHLAARKTLGLRIPPRIVVRRRNLRLAPRPSVRALHRGS